jgi:hypothetical protein
LSGSSLQPDGDGTFMGALGKWGSAIGAGLFVVGVGTVIGVGRGIGRRGRSAKAHTGMTIALALTGVLGFVVCVMAAL